jgi:hypothetical protein
VANATGRSRVPSVSLSASDAVDGSSPGDMTLVLNDVLSNVRHPKGLGAQVMARLLGFGVSRPRTSRPVRLMFVKDPAALAKQFRAWTAIPQLRRIIVSHGDIIDQAPREALMQAAGDFD